MSSTACTRCGILWPDTSTYWYFYGGRRHGQQCKCCLAELDKLRRAARRKPVEPRPCCICGEMFLPTSKLANRRIVCYRPECIQSLHRQYYGRHKSRYWANEIRNRRSLRLDKPDEYVRCPLCGYRRMPSHYTYCCDHCREAAGRTDGDHIYVSMEV